MPGTMSDAIVFITGAALQVQVRLSACEKPAYLVRSCFRWRQ